MNCDRRFTRLKCQIFVIVDKKEEVCLLEIWSGWLSLYLEVQFAAHIERKNILDNESFSKEYYFCGDSNHQNMSHNMSLTSP